MAKSPSLKEQYQESLNKLQQLGKKLTPQELRAVVYRAKSLSPNAKAYLEELDRKLEIFKQLQKEQEDQELADQHTQETVDALTRATEPEIQAETAKPATVGKKRK